MVQDKLRLNNAKTEFLIIGTRAQLNKVTISDLQVGEVKVSAVYSVRNLGACFDANMNMRVSMGLTDRRKTAKNLVDSRKN